MKGLIVVKAGAPYELSTDIEKPTPGTKQVLVKSLYTAMNPVETFMSASGRLVRSWPIVLGCDASGVVVEVGEGIQRLKKGDAVFGCTRLGSQGYGTFQEYFLMDEDLALLKPDNISLEQAATVGVGALTACMGLVTGLGMKLPEKGESPKVDEWAIVLGGSGSVGQFAVQIAKRCGYKVLTTCSSANEALVKTMGASATISYKLDQATQLEQVSSLTGGNFSGVLDTTATSATSALEFLDKASKSHHPKRFSSVDDWSEIEPPKGIAAHRISLGDIGQPGKEHVSAGISTFIPYIESYLAEGSIKPPAVQIAGSGFEAVSGAVDLQNKGGKGGQKVVVKIQDL